MFRSLLDFNPAVPPPTAVGVWRENSAVGLALGTGADGRAAKMLSLYVDDGHRGKGIATLLLAQAEAELMRAGAAEVAATYMTGQPTTAALEAVLRKRAWDEPQARALVVRCTLESIRHARWIRAYPLPHGWSIVRWVELGDALREEIRRTQELHHWIPPDLEPFRHEAGLEPVTSLALLVKGAVRGWVINHVVDGVLRFTCSFVHRDLQRMARVLMLYNEAVARMPDIGLSVGMWTVPLAHRGMVRFARRWMQPYAIFFGETRGTRKCLTPPGAT